jgi:hypothetical protein
MTDLSCNSENVITVYSKNKNLFCSFAEECKKDMKEFFDIDIIAEIENLLNKFEISGYASGKYVFSFKNKILSLHHSELKKEINNNVTKILKRYAYEINDEDTRLNVKTDVINLLNMLKDKFALYNFCIICDETNNTEDNKLNLRLAFKETNSISEEPTIIDYTLGFNKK